MRVTLLALALLALPAPAAASASCAGDCDGDGRVHIAELLRGIPCMLACVGCCEIDDCYDADGNGAIVVNELILAVNHALYGCPVTYKLYVRVQSYPGQNRHVRGGSVLLLPPGRHFDRFDVDQGWFRFDGVPPGDYTLAYDYDPSAQEPVLCNLFGCWPRRHPVSIVDADVSTTIPIHVPCRDSDDCSVGVGQRCVEPGGFVGCGICQDAADECADDADCGGLAAGRVCSAQAQPPCPCDGIPALICAPVCGGAAGCAVGQACTEDGHCGAATCGDGDECPPLFDCAGSAPDAPRTCGRRRCATDDDCGPGNYCVLASCYDERGACQAIPP